MAKRAQLSPGEVIDGVAPIPNARREAFAHHYVSNNNGTQAAKAAGYSDKTAASQGAFLLTDPHVVARITVLRAKAFEGAEMKARDVMQEWVDIIRADPSELVDIRAHCCRYCHGEEHQYQYTRNEWRRRIVRAERALQNKRAKKINMDPLGGASFNPTLKPHESCPECHGLGEIVVHVRDLRTVSPRARKLFAGVKVRNGRVSQVMFESKENARELLARHLGMFVERHVDVSAMSDEELDALINSR